MAKKIRKMRYKILPLTITMPFGDTQNTIHPTLLWDQQNIILVDGGFIGSCPMLDQELLLHGISLQQLTGLVLTHHDHDHIGAAAALKRVNPNCKYTVQRRKHSLFPHRKNRCGCVRQKKCK
ncbi:MBL fold metallo-hydrolase [Sporomusa sphaeroides]|uniref:Metallo-beta-lactamase superfamily protein n=1 Tax=Sporomusa sphaeroides DSM 2875 TaxID=1337886 RepID=A0ABM9W1U5_9FIRM|nr:MBL fold metallo-hydrolase [Sporomusa sphaeroides]OLS55811.1 metallo-beta-lactamase superfamily protein [Sporomusa sphaeroides DSM 2875]CVK18812.1 Metallo-beta-lactamase superfamily protein [Sporomusa sphaeroides DSM 2875]